MEAQIRMGERDFKTTISLRIGHVTSKILGLFVTLRPEDTLAVRVNACQHKETNVQYIIIAFKNSTFDHTDIQLSVSIEEESL